MNPLGDVAGDFDVLHLVGPDRHEVTVVKQNVGRHQHGIGKEPRVGRQAFGLFVLIGVALFQKVHRRDGHQEPCQLGNFRHVRLAKERGLFRIEAQREIREGHLAGVLLEEQRIVHGGQGVQVGDEVERLLIVLQLNVLADRAEIIAPMGKAGGLDSGEHAHQQT